MPVDLRSFLRSVGNPVFAPGPNTDPGERLAPETPAELLEQSPLRVTATPAEVGAFVDGCQSIVTLTWREHRPIHLLWIAAGALGPNGRGLTKREELFATAAPQDLDWVRERDGNMTVVELPDCEPHDLDRAAAHMLAGRREELEREVVGELVGTTDAAIVVDGSLLARPNTRQLMGLVKSTRTRYLADESIVRRLPVGWRSPRFKVPNRKGGAQRYSCYLRLTDATARPWNWGLVRVEAFDPDCLESYCALALVERQLGSSDPRWDRHLSGVHACEEFLKGHRPKIFG